MPGSSVSSSGCAGQLLGLLPDLQLLDTHEPPLDVGVPGHRRLPRRGTRPRDRNRQVRERQGICGNPLTIGEMLVQYRGELVEQRLAALQLRPIRGTATD